jgi:hypothetical protein
VRAWAISYRALSFFSSSGYSEHQDILNGPWKSGERTTSANDCLRDRIAIYVLNSKQAAMSTILVTGGSGFIGSRSILWPGAIECAPQYGA